MDSSDDSDIESYNDALVTAAECALSGKPLEYIPEIDFGKDAKILYNYIKTKQYDKIADDVNYLRPVIDQAINMDNIFTIYELGKISKDIADYIFDIAANRRYSKTYIGKDMSRFIYTSFCYVDRQHDEFAVYMRNKKRYFDYNLQIISVIRHIIPKDVWNIISAYW